MFGRFWRNGNSKVPESGAQLDTGFLSIPPHHEPSINSLVAEAPIAEYELMKQYFAGDVKPPSLPVETDDPDAWYQQGNLYRNAGKLDVALACYNKTIELQPHNQAAWANLAWVLVGLNR